MPGNARPHASRQANPPLPSRLSYARSYEEMQRDAARLGDEERVVGEEAVTARAVVAVSNAEPAGGSYDTAAVSTLEQALARHTQTAEWAAERAGRVAHDLSEERARRTAAEQRVGVLVAALQAVSARYRGEVTMLRQGLEALKDGVSGVQVRVMGGRLTRLDATLPHIQAYQPPSPLGRDAGACVWG